MYKKIGLSILLWMLTAQFTTTAYAQCGCAENFETTFPEAVKAAPVVIEGHLQHAEQIMFGGEYNDLYKSTKITVYKVLKGNINAQEIELISPNVSYSHGCSEGMSTGVFMLYPSEVKASPRNEIAPEHKFKYRFLPRIGCNTVNYNATDNKGRENYVESPYGIYSTKDLPDKVYKVVEKQTGQKYKEIAALPKKDFGGSYMTDATSKNGEKQAINIASISPTTVTAGTFDTLTITGTGFTPDLTVGFRNPEIYEEKYIAVPKNHIIYRDSIMFMVLVPCVELSKNVNRPDDGVIIIAGTGKIAIMKGGDVKRKSAQTLTVSYARNTYAATDTSATIYPILLSKNNAGGDFMFWLHPSLRNNAPAKELVAQAMEQWRCASGVNFTIACDSTSIVPKRFDDNLSTFSFTDPTDTNFYSAVGTNYKAVTVNRLRFCNTQNAVVVTASDVIFRNFPPLGNGEANWYYQNYNTGPINSGEYDFYTMALHELGHAHLLDHVIDHNQLMDTYHFPENLSVIHNINPTTDLVAAINIMTVSVSSSVSCAPMQAVPDSSCLLPDCAFIDCGDPGYPLQVYFSLMPEACLSNPDFDDVSDAWQQMVGANVSVWAQDQSIGNIIDRTWVFSSDAGTVSDMPCDLESDADTCFNLFWTFPGQKQVSLTVTDANGCQITQEQNLQVISPDCPLPPSVVQITSTQLTCDTALSDCPDSQNGQIFMTPPPSLAGDCYVFYAEYSTDNPNVSIPEDYYSDAAFEHLPDGRRWLGCLPAGYYKIRMTDEVSTCFNTAIVHVPFDAAPPLVFISQHTANLAYGGTLNGLCGGRIQIDEINGEPFDEDDYIFAWSDCSDCDAPARQHLCLGTYTVTATNRHTGCSGLQTITLQLQCNDSGSGGEAVGVVDVYPTVYDNTANLRILLNYDTEVTIDVYDLYGAPIKRLMDGEAKQAGEYYLQDNTTAAPDGVYLYVVKACDQIKTDIGIKY